MTRILLLLLAALAFTMLAGAAPQSDQQPASSDDWKGQFKPRLGSGPQATPAPKRKDRVTYTLHKADEPSAEEQAAYEGIIAGMEKAVRFYNTHAPSIEKQLNVFYNPGVPTADGNINGSIRLGKSARNQRVCMHEICHTVGVGTSPQWGKLVVKGVFTGKHATECLRTLTGDKDAVLHADRMHFWPYGLNYDNEVKSDEDFIRHCKIVEAICKDLKDAR